MTVPVRAQETVGFPRGTTQFFGVRDLRRAVATPDGGVWIVTQDALIHYTKNGPGTTIPVSRDSISIAVAPDGSIWLAGGSGVTRFAACGVVIETYSMERPRGIAVTPDGATWYGRETHPPVIGRIANGVITEFPSPTRPSSLAAASNGDVWILGEGSGTPENTVFRMTPAGIVSSLPLPESAVWGELQTLPDGTLFVHTGFRYHVLRLDPGKTTFAVFPLHSSGYYAADTVGNLWTGGWATIGYIGRPDSPRLSVPMPHDPRLGRCLEVPSHFYRVWAVDSAGGVWVEIREVPPFPPSNSCSLPAPPPLPTLIRIDGIQFLRDHGPAHVPALSPLMLTALSLVLAIAAAWQVRSRG